MSKATEDLQFWYRKYKAKKLMHKTIAINLQKRRQELGISQKKLALIVGCSQPNIARDERQSYTGHSLNTLCGYAVALETTVSKLLDSSQKLKGGDK